LADAAREGGLQFLIYLLWQNLVKIAAVGSRTIARRAIRSHREGRLHQPLRQGWSKADARFSFSALDCRRRQERPRRIWLRQSQRSFRSDPERPRNGQKSLVKVAVCENTIPARSDRGARRRTSAAPSCFAGTAIMPAGRGAPSSRPPGIRDVLAKSLGASNHANVVKGDAGGSPPAPPQGRNLQTPRHSVPLEAIRHGVAAEIAATEVAAVLISTFA